MSQSSSTSSFVDRFWPLVKYTDLRPQFQDRIATGPSLRACISVQRRQLTIWQGAQLVDKLDLSAAARDRNASVRARGNAVAFRVAGPDGGGSQSTAPFKHFRVRLATFQERTSLCSALAQFVLVEESPGTASQFSQESPVLATTPPLTQWLSASTPTKLEITSEWARRAEKESKRGSTEWARQPEKESGYSQQWKPPLLQQATEPEEEKAFPLHKLPPPVYRTPKRPGEVLSPQDLSTTLAKKMKQCEQQSAMTQPAFPNFSPPLAMQNQDDWNWLRMPAFSPQNSNQNQDWNGPRMPLSQSSNFSAFSPQNSNQNQDWNGPRMPLSQSSNFSAFSPQNSNQNQNAWQDHHSPMAEEDVRDDFSDSCSGSELSSQCSDYGGSLDSTFSSQLSSSSQMDMTSWPSELMMSSSQQQEMIPKEEFFSFSSSSSPSSQLPTTSMLSAVPKEYYSDSSSQQQEEEKCVLLEPRATVVSQATQTDAEDALGELEAMQCGELNEYMGEITAQPGFARLLETLGRLIKSDGALAQRMEHAMRRMEMAEEERDDDDEEEEMLAETPPPQSQERQEEEEGEEEDESALLGWE